MFVFGDPTTKGRSMGLFDKAKQAIAGNKRQVKQGIDKAAQVADDKAGAHADKVHKGARVAKDQVDKLDSGDSPAADDAGTAPDDTSR